MTLPRGRCYNQRQDMEFDSKVDESEAQEEEEQNQDRRFLWR